LIINHITLYFRKDLLFIHDHIYQIIKYIYQRNIVTIHEAFYQRIYNKILNVNFAKNKLIKYYFQLFVKLITFIVTLKLYERS